MCMTCMGIYCALGAHRKRLVNMHLVNRPLTNESTLNCSTEKVAIDNHERVIFYRLGTNHVFFDIPNQLIYFSDLDETPVFSLLEALYSNKAQSFVLE